MEKFEYRIEYLPIGMETINWLNQLGQEGWELIFRTDISPVAYYFKRKIVNNNDEI